MIPTEAEDSLICLPPFLFQETCAYRRLRAARTLRDVALGDAYERLANAYTLVLLCDLDEPKLEYTFQEPGPPRAMHC